MSSSLKPTDRPQLDVATSSLLVRLAILAATVASVIAVVAAHRNSPVLAVCLIPVVVALGRLSAIDVAQHRLPNRITGPLALASVVGVSVAGVVGSDLGAALASVGLGLLFAVGLLVMRFGMGDVKLAVTIGTIAGWLGGPAIMVTLLVASGSGALAAAVLMVVHRRRSLVFGFGPFLALGSVAGMIAAGA